MFPLMLAPLCHLYPIMLCRRKPWLWLKQPSWPQPLTPAFHPKSHLEQRLGNGGNGKVSLRWTSDYLHLLFSFTLYILYSFHLDTPRRHQIATGGHQSGGGRHEEFRRKGSAKFHPYCVPWYRWDMLGYG